MRPTVRLLRGGGQYGNKFAAYYQDETDLKWYIFLNSKPFWCHGRHYISYSVSRWGSVLPVLSEEMYYIWSSDT